MAPPSLVGPPQVINTVTPAQPNSGARPPMGLTENLSPTFMISGNPCLDLFFRVVPDTPASYLNKQLPIAWAYNALTTLKLICNLRGVRGTGKSDKEGFYTAALWLHRNHPKTLACNVASLANFGHFKDLPEILYRLLEGQDVRENRKMNWQERKYWTIRRVVGRRRRTVRRGAKTNIRKPKVISRHKLPKDVREKMAAQKRKLEKEKVSAARLEKKIAIAKKAVARYQLDSDYWFLHDRVSDLFAHCLEIDLDHLKSNNCSKISLAPKWCPSLDSSFDSATLLCESIARKIFTRESYPEYQGIEEAHYAYRV
ncbi:hypothetical protein M0R45_023500 [Rubus argutus]|uniref:DUF2828 domain-containing protein n=1 Tax=Rubus argutus TaxID=59490 RepID=A0AAW1WN70_RUBAR